MRRHPVVPACLVLVAALALAGCGRTWVDADASGCSAQDVHDMNNSGPHGVTEMMGTGVCRAHGLQRFDGKWRCNGHTLQVACK